MLRQTPPDFIGDILAEVQIFANQHWPWMPAKKQAPNLRAEKLVLCSQSPRRIELMHRFQIPFETQTVPLDETAIHMDIETHLKCHSPQWTPDLVGGFTALTCAIAKARTIAHQTKQPKTLFLAADTTVTFKGGILHKPHHLEAAKQMLTQLCGEIQTVQTASVLLQTDETGSLVDEWLDIDQAYVQFFPLDQAQAALIDRYLATGSPLDKAGAYGIQDMGALLIQHMNGDFYTIMGLPIAKLHRPIRERLHRQED